MFRGQILEIHNVPWNGSERLMLMVRGLKNTAPAESKRPKRIAVTPQMLEDLHNLLDHDDPKDASILACANAAFWGQGRLGEFLATSRLKHNPTTHPSSNSSQQQLSRNTITENKDKSSKWPIDFPYATSRSIGPGQRDRKPLARKLWPRRLQPSIRISLGQIPQRSALTHA